MTDLHLGKRGALISQYFVSKNLSHMNLSDRLTGPSMVCRWELTPLQAFLPTLCLSTCTVREHNRRIDMDITTKQLRGRPRLPTELTYVFVLAHF